MGIKVRLNKVKLSYPHLWEPHAAVPGGTEKYGAAFLLDPATHRSDLQNLAKVRQQLIDEQLKGKAPSKAWPLYKGSEKYPDNPFYANLLIINAYSLEKPALVDESVNELMDRGKLYPGAIVNAAIDVYVYRQPVSGITFGLNGVQFVEDGERLDNRPTKDDMFDALAADVTSMTASGGEEEETFDWES